MSIEGDTCQHENSFRHGTIKIATMIFKRMAFESRRKIRGVLRPKVRQDYTELTGPWPRTSTEKLLGDMFDCRCAQFLAILQALSDSNRRLVLTSPSANDQDMELLDVTSELFYAAQYILQGNDEIDVRICAHHAHIFSETRQYRSIGRCQCKQYLSECHIERRHEFT
jgi:hypothetical protein